MATKVTVDSAGRVLLPKALRERWHLEPGDVLEMETEDEEIKLRMVRSRPPMTKERGVWVFRTGGREQLSAEAVEKAIEAVRAERDLTNLGGE